MSLFKMEYILKAYFLVLLLDFTRLADLVKVKMRAFHSLNLAQQHVYQNGLCQSRQLFNIPQLIDVNVSSMSKDKQRTW